MLNNIRRKRSQISTALYEVLLSRLSKFLPKVLKVNLGKLRLGEKTSKSFRYFGQGNLFSSEICKMKNVEFKMIECPADIFIMGDAGISNNQPRLKIVERAFLLGETEVTQELYEAVMGKNPSKFKNPQKPVENLSWFEMIDFCNKLSSLQGSDECYSIKKTKIGILRSEMPSEKKELVKYNKFYDVIRNQIVEDFEYFNPRNVEFEIEYDPDISTCDVVITDRIEDGVYSIEPNWVEGIKGKYSFNLGDYSGNRTYFFYKEAKEELDSFLRTLKGPIFICDFSKNGYRLPTEKEWEYAAKAGTKNKWAGTDYIDDIGKYAQYGGNRATGSTHLVATKLPNEWGFYDMGGNVEEACWDMYSDDSDYRVCRGGSWADNHWNLRSSYRMFVFPNLGSGREGFRICRSIGT